MKKTFYTFYTKWLQADGLNLTINEAAVLSVIYGLSNTSKLVCKGSNYISTEINMPVRTVYRIIDSLIEKNLVIKIENGRGKQNYFSITEYCQNVTSDKIEPVTPCHPSSDTMSPEVVTPCHPSSDTMSPEVVTPCHPILIDNTKDNTKNNTKDINTRAKKVEDKKHKYGEYNNVLLKDSERDKLMNEYGEHETLESIKFLDEYIEMKGYKAKSHYLCIRKWVFKAIKEEQQRKNRNSGGNNAQYMSKTEQNMQHNFDVIANADLGGIFDE